MFSVELPYHHTAYIYLRGEYASLGRILEDALAEARAAGLIGSTLLDSSFALRLCIQLGAGAYICGEETGLIQSLEGRRAYPRVRPPPDLDGCGGAVRGVEWLTP